MTPSEIAFLALGIVLGTAVGAAIVQAMNRRPAPRREVKLTITQNAIPSRTGSTLALPRGITIEGPMPGSPAALALENEPGEGGLPGTEPVLPAVAAGGPGGSQGRTRVPSGAIGIPASAVAVPVVDESLGETPAAPGPVADPAPVSHPADGPSSLAGSPATAVAVLEAPPTARPTPSLVGVVIPLTDAPAGGDGNGTHAVPFDETFTTLVRPRPPVDTARPVLPATAVAIRMHAAPILRPVAMAGPPGGGQGGAPGAAQPGTDADPCVGVRRLVDERCALADAAQEQARNAADALREAQRQYDILRERVDAAQLTADPRHVAAAKERLHAAFRRTSERAAGPDETEAAARAWLQQINDLNTAVREATRILENGGAELRARLPVLDRLAAEADAARIAGENAEGGCREAREQLAACEEADARARANVPPEPEEPHPFEGVWPADQPELPGPVPSPADLLSGLPVIVRVLRGDREARQRLIASLAAGGPEDEREWGLRVSRLVDAIVARAIEDGYLDVPDDDPFWRLFEYREKRDIVGALSALGYRYDGLGGFADGRVPAPRDLSLAVGYAGLDRMRIRTWPRDSDLALLYERAVVAADEWLSDQAGDLSLGRMVDALGNRAADLADIWNAWGRVRPALLAG